jgi:hypothetical protein
LELQGGNGLRKTCAFEAGLFIRDRFPISLGDAGHHWETRAGLSRRIFVNEPREIH